MTLRNWTPEQQRAVAGAPGLGPLTLRRELVIFKSGFRSRSYCLQECTQVCAASFNGPPAGLQEQQPQMKR